MNGGTIPRFAREVFDCCTVGEQSINLRKWSAYPAILSVNADIPVWRPSAISRREQAQQHACAEAGLTRSPRRRATETNPGWSGRWPWRWSDRLRPGGDHPDVVTTLIAGQICGRLTRFLESQSEPLEACYRLG